MEPDETLADRIQLLAADLSHSATYMSPGKKLLRIFPDEPQEEHVHIIVQSPSPGKCSEDACP
jgi:hypothetical protein